MTKKPRLRGLPNNKDLCALRKKLNASHYCISLWMYIRGWMTIDNKTCTASQEQMAEDLGCSLSSIERSVRESRNYGALIVKRLPKQPSQQYENNEYRFNFPWPSLQKPAVSQKGGSTRLTDGLSSKQQQVIFKEKKKPKKEPFVVAKDLDNNLPPAFSQKGGNELPDFSTMSEKEKQDWAVDHVYDPYSTQQQEARQSREAVLAIMKEKGVVDGKGLLKKHTFAKVKKYLPFLSHKAGNPAGLFIAALNGNWVENRNLKRVNK